jgi:hypothetical protein
LRALLVIAHPLDNAFAKAAAERIRAMLERRGIEVDMIDLYADNFDPRLAGAERRGYFTAPGRPWRRPWRAGFRSTRTRLEPLFIRPAASVPILAHLGLSRRSGRETASRFCSKSRGPCR